MKLVEKSPTHHHDKWATLGNMMLPKLLSVNAAFSLCTSSPRKEEKKSNSVTEKIFSICNRWILNGRTRARSSISNVTSIDSKMSSNFMQHSNLCWNAEWNCNGIINVAMEFHSSPRLRYLSRSILSKPASIPRLLPSKQKLLSRTVKLVQSEGTLFALCLILCLGLPIHIDGPIR